jgi:proteasome assembly chaperone (PAC2) family protein
MQNAPALGIQCISLWAHLPFYLKGPSELLMTHYLQVLGSLLETELNTDHLMAAWEERLEEIEELIDQDRDLRQLLEQLKSHKDDDKLLPGTPAKVVRLDEFLRKRGDTGPDSEA